jgi:hypothetical protein
VHVAVPHEAPADVPVPVGVGVTAGGQSEAKLLELAIESHVLPSMHVSCSAVGLELQTWLLQFDFALSASAPHVVNFASQRLAQSAAEAGVEPPDEPDVPLPDEPEVPEVVEEQATATTVAAASTAKLRRVREE